MRGLSSLTVCAGDKQWISLDQSEARESGILISAMNILICMTHQLPPPQNRIY